MRFLWPTIRPKRKGHVVKTEARLCFLVWFFFCPPDDAGRPVGLIAQAELY